MCVHTGAKWESQYINFDALVVPIHGLLYCLLCTKGRIDCSWIPYGLVTRQTNSSLWILSLTESNTNSSSDSNEYPTTTLLCSHLIDSTSRSEEQTIEALSPSVNVSLLCLVASPKTYRWINVYHDYYTSLTFH